MCVLENEVSYAPKNYKIADSADTEFQETIWRKIISISIPVVILIYSSPPSGPQNRKLRRPTMTAFLHGTSIARMRFRPQFPSTTRRMRYRHLMIIDLMMSYVNDYASPCELFDFTLLDLDSTTLRNYFYETTSRRYTHFYSIERFF